MTVKLLPRVPNVNLDDNVGKGMDLALTTLLFLGIGYVLDRWLDTKPLFMIAMTLIAAFGKGLGMYYAYQAQMQALDAERAAARHAAPRATYQLPAEPDTAAGITPEQMR